MEKRTILAVVICVAILFVWTKFFGPTPAPTAPPTATAPKASAPVGAGAVGAGAAGTGATAPSAAPAPDVEKRAQEWATIGDDDIAYVFSSWGATLVSAKLKDPRFVADRKVPESRISVVPSFPPQRAPLWLSFGKGQVRIPDDASWTIRERTDKDVTFQLALGHATIVKTFRLQPGSYQVRMDVVIENTGAVPLDDVLVVHLPHWQDPEKQGGGFLSGASANPAQLVCFANEEIERVGIADALSSPGEKMGVVGWVAADEKFFTTALVPHPEAAKEPRKCSWQAKDTSFGDVSLAMAARTVPPGGKTTYEFTVFSGPKLLEKLEAISFGGVSAQLRDLIDVTFGILSRPLLWLLKVFQGWVGNWGLAIIMLTFSVKLLTFWPTQKAMMSGKKMQRLGPEMAKIRQQFETDRQRQSVEMMAMYKRHGVSPFGGCLPSLITMPIWIALFSTLNYAVELHRAPFIWYIQDLSAQDQYYVTPLLMGGIMFLQMRMSPAGTDPQQQKMMSIMMPVMFTAFSLFLPAGLALYTLTNSLLAILQQVLVNHIDAKQGPIDAKQGPIGAKG